MHTTLYIYIAIGVLTLVPLIGFNIRKIWVRRPPEPVRFKPMRCGVIVLLSALIAAFLIGGYQSTLRNRGEVALEMLAEQHARVLIGQSTPQELRAYLVEHGTDQVGASFDQLDIQAGQAEEARFQRSALCLPQLWEGKDGYEGVVPHSEEDPVYAMYRLQAGGQTGYYVVRMTRTDAGWKFDWFGTREDGRDSAIRMPTEENGKWYTIR